MSNYRGPGKYRHYKGGEYHVLGLALKEDTVRRENEPNQLLICTHCGSRGTEIDCANCGYARALMEVTMVIYRPLTASMLDDREEDFWARELGDFNELVRIPHGQGSAPGVEGEPGNSYVSRFTFINGL